MRFEEFAAARLPAVLRFAGVLTGDRALPNGTGADVDNRRTPDHAVAHAERDALLTEVGKLPRRQRAVLVLRYYEGFSDSEIAELLGCTAGTVRGYASRALATLRVEMSGIPLVESARSDSGEN